MAEESGESKQEGSGLQMDVQESAGVGGAESEGSSYPNPADTVDDLACAAELTDKGLLQQLQQRFHQEVIYTFSGRLLVAVNPFKALPLYGANELISYQCASVHTNRPHVFSVSDKAFSSLMATSSDQTIIISGDSGSGKTEACKHVLKHVLDSSLIASRGDDLHSRQVEVRSALIRSGSLLETFGNARSEQNKNSSRFGRVTEVGVASGGGDLTSAKIFHFCLGTERLTCSSKPNFHVFSYMIAGVSRDLLNQMGIDKDRIESHDFLRGRVTVDEDALIGYSRMRTSFDTLGMTVQQLSQLYSVLGAIIRLGDIKFQKSNVASQPEVPQSDTKTSSDLFTLSPELEKSWSNHRLHSVVLTGLMAAVVAQQRSSAAVKGAKEEVNFWENETKKSDNDVAAEIANEETVKVVGDLLKVDHETVKAVLLRTERGEARNIFQASLIRDVIARQLYNGLFTWLVMQINNRLASLCAPLCDGSPVNTITILDTCGFENHSIGRFEDLCNNTVSEALHQLFWQRLVVYEEEQYHNEGIEWNNISHDYNEPIVNLLIQSEGILDTVDTHSESSSLCSATETQQRDKMMGCLSKLSEGSHHCYIVQDHVYQFVVCHFTGEVTYDCQDFLMDNGEVMPQAVVELLQTSNCKLVQEIAESCSKPSDRWAGHLPEGKSHAARLKNGMSFLVEKIKQTTPHFICCIKPNNSQNPGVFDEDCVLPQIQHYGLLEAALMTVHGYPFRLTFKEFIYKYSVIGFNRLVVEATNENCRVILQAVQLDGWHIGQTMVLMKVWHEIELEEAVCDRHVKAAKIQRAFLAYLQSKKPNLHKPLTTTSKQSLHNVSQQPGEKNDVMQPPPLPKRRLTPITLSGNQPPALPPKALKVRSVSSGSMLTTTLEPEDSQQRLKSRAHSTSVIPTAQPSDIPALPPKKKSLAVPYPPIQDVTIPPPLPKRSTPPHGALGALKLQPPRAKEGNVKSKQEGDVPEYLELIDNGPLESLAGGKEEDEPEYLDLIDSDECETHRRRLSSASDKKQNRRSLTSLTLQTVSFFDADCDTSAEYLELITEVPEEQEGGLKQPASPANPHTEQNESDDFDDGYVLVQPLVRRMPPPIEKTEKNWGLSKQRSASESRQIRWDAAAFSKAKETMEDLERQPWYHGSISRAQADSRLLATPCSQFLIRQSESSQGFSLSISHRGSTKHYLINTKPSTNRYIIIGNTRTFPSLSVLVSYHYNHVVSAAGELLTRPCPKQAKVFTTSLSSPELQPSSVPLRPQNPRGHVVQRDVHKVGLNLQGGAGTRTWDPTGRRATGNNTRRISQQTAMRKSMESSDPSQLPSNATSLDQPGEQQAAADDPAVASKIQELTRLLDLEQKIVDAAERTMDLPNIDKKTKKRRKKSLARSHTKVLKLKAQLSELQQKRIRVQMSAKWLQSMS